MRDVWARCPRVEFRLSVLACPIMDPVPRGMKKIPRFSQEPHVSGIQSKTIDIILQFSSSLARKMCGEMDQFIVLSEIAFRIH